MADDLSAVLVRISRALDIAADARGSENERRNAALVAATLIRKHGLAVVPYEDVVYPPETPSADGAPSVVHVAARSAGTEIGRAAGRGLEAFGGWALDRLKGKKR